MIAKVTGGVIVAIGALFLMAWAWQTAPLIILGVLLIIGGWTAIAIFEANRRIRTTRARWEEIYEERRARTVDDEVEMMDEEGGFV